jgi:hypothetical protein
MLPQRRIDVLPFTEKRDHQGLHAELGPGKRSPGSSIVPRALPNRVNAWASHWPAIA